MSLSVLLSRYPVQTLNVELTNACNLRCPLCLTGSGTLNDRKGFMDFESFRRFYDATAGLFRRVSLIGRGEPTLHKEWFKFARYVSRSGGGVMYTNGATKATAEDLMESRLKQVHFEVDGVSSEQHAMYRIGADLELVCAKIEKAVRYKLRYRMRFPEIHMRVLLSAKNEDNYTDFLSMARELGVDVIHFTGIHDSISGTDEWFPKSHRFRQRVRASKYDCPFKRSLIGVLAWDGSVLLCCGTVPDAMISKLNAFEEPDILGALSSDRVATVTQRCGTFAFCRECAMARYDVFHETQNVGSARLTPPNITRRVWYRAVRCARRSAKWK